MTGNLWAAAAATKWKVAKKSITDNGGKWLKTVYSAFFILFFIAYLHDSLVSTLSVRIILEIKGLNNIYVKLYWKEYIIQGT